MKTNNLKQNKGFTIIESLVAITILVIAVTGPLALASKGLAYSNYVKDEITAFYLANEAMDAIRNIRDANLRGAPTTDPWYWQKINYLSSDTLLSEKCGNDFSPCFFDVWKTPFDFRKAFDLGADAKLSKVTCSNNGAVYYGYDFSSISSNFTSDCTPPPYEISSYSRTIKVEKVNLVTNDEIRVTVVVDWYSGSIKRNVIITENLFKLIP